MDGKQLKNSILQWAIQGKLVPQNPKDEPASILLEKIRNAKENLVKQGKIKKKELENEPVLDEEIPFDIPQNWSWCRLEDIIWHLSDGTHKTPKYTETGIPFISVKNMSSGKLSFENTKFVSKKESDELNQRCNPEKGDLLLSKVGTTGIPVIVDVDVQFSLFVSLALIKFFPNLIDSSFFVYLIKSPLVQTQVKEHTRGVGNKNWVLNDISKTVLAIPPLAEQKRIVAKLEQVLPLADEYGAAQEQLDKLNKELPEALKKSILQQAIQGKLVPQNPKDEPAQKLLEKIRNEKEILVKQGKLKKKDLKYNPIDEDEIPFELPENWVWCRLGDIVSKLVDGDHNPPAGVSKKTVYMMLSSRNINFDKLADLDNVRYLEADVFSKENERTEATIGDVLFTSVGTIGRSCVLKEDVKICFQRSVTIMTTYVYNEYLKRFFDSPFYQNYANEHAVGTAQRGFYLKEMEQSLIALPPLAEQKRIVTKLEQLFKVL